jgi:sulfite reductase (ferredoxin)
MSQPSTPPSAAAPTGDVPARPARSVRAERSETPESSAPSEPSARSARSEPSARSARSEPSARSAPSEPSAPSARSVRPARPVREQRSNGQWAVDGTTPLNANEEWKQRDGGLNVRQRIEEIYSREGFDSIPSEDLHGRFRWWGLYTQRRPGIDGGRTAQLEPHEISDRYFMLRVRIDGGALTTEQLRVVAGISTEFARDTADITDRQNIQLHWVEVESVPEIWRRLEAVGLRTTEACGDTPRVILGSPVAGIAADEIIDSTPAVEAISRRFIGDPAFANLPRKFKTAVTGHPSQDVVHEINDVSFVGVRHPELGVGYDVWVGGGLSTNAHLVADWGAEKFRQVLQDEYLYRMLPDGPAPEAPVVAGDHVGVHAQKDRKFYVGVAPAVGRISGSMLNAVADIAEGIGSRGIRLTPYQKLLVLDVPPERVDDVVARLEELGLQARPARFRRHTIACTGIEYCKLAIVETKITATDAIEELDRRLADVELDRPITLHVNGCPNSCARIQTADIGLKGQLVPTAGGGQEPGFQVHLGGGLASADREEPGLGRTVRGLKVTAADLPDYVERVVRRFLQDREAGEAFAAWAHRAEEGALQ